MASLAGTSYVEDSGCDGAPSVSVLQIHGTEDAVILFDGDESDPDPKGNGERAFYAGAPDMVMRCLHKLKEISVLFGEAQIAAGADALTFPDHATGDLVSGDYYQRFLLEIHQEMVERLPTPLILHICGNTLDRMDYIAQTGMASFHFDSKNDPQAAMDTVSGRIGLVGNINNPQTLYARRPEEVRQEVFRCLDAGVQMVAPRVCGTIGHQVGEPDGDPPCGEGLV